MNELETALAQLSPRVPAGFRDRLLFEAGRRSRRNWAWPALAACFAVTSICLACVVILRPAPEPVVQIVWRTKEAPREEKPAMVRENKPTEDPNPQPFWPWSSIFFQPALAGPGDSYLRTRDFVLRFGIESLPVNTDFGGEEPEALPPMPREPLTAG